MHTDDIRFSVPDVWMTLYSALHGTLWEDEDIEYAVYKKNHDAIAAALALRSVYSLEWNGVEAEDGVFATLKAAQEFHGGTQLTASHIRTMAASFICHYRDRLEPFDDYLEEHCGEVRWDWLNSTGRQEISRAVRRDSEIWVTNVNASDDVWVFTKPGTA